MSNQHVLKIHPVPLADLMSGAKTAEVRRNDRDFQVGDTVRLMEVNPETLNWTGRPDLVRTISHIQTGYGLPDGMCVLSYSDTAQREALARVEAELKATDQKLLAKTGAHEFVKHGVNRLVAERDAAQAQLAEAVGLVRQMPASAERNAFLARAALAAQAERQEAKGAQAGGLASAVRVLLEVPQLQGEQAFSAQPIIDRVRAALATQPAAGEPIHQWADQDLWMDGDEADMASARAEGFKTRTLWTAPPAAAHGDEAVRKDAEAAYVEMTCQPVLIDGATHYYLSSEKMQAFDRLFSVDVSDAAMRAQGDGSSGNA